MARRMRRELIRRGLDPHDRRRLQTASAQGRLALGRHAGLRPATLGVVPPPDVAGIALLRTLSPESEAVTWSTPWGNPQIDAAVQLGLGAGGPDEIVLVGPTAPAADLARYQALAAT